MSSNNTYEFNEISGRMLTVDYAVSHHAFDITTKHPNAFQNIVKDKLCNMLIQELKKNNFIEFTRQEVPGQDITKFRARIFVTPDDQVRILRQHSKL